MSNHNSISDLADARGGAADSLASRAHEGLDTLSERTDAAGRRMRDKAAKVTDRVGQAAGRAREKGAQVKQTVSAYTGENPMMSLAIAFFAGVLLVAMARRSVSK